MADKKANNDLEGFERCVEMFGEEHVRNRLERWKGLGEIGELLKNFSYGGLYERTVLDLKTHEICAVAALTAVDGRHHLKSHIKAALRVGATVEEVTEVIFQTSPYCGTSIATDGYKVLQEVLAEQKKGK